MAEDKLTRDLPNTAKVNAPAVLLPYQRRWIETRSPLKIGEKSRRIGLTWAEAADNVLTAGAEQGQNVYYIGYNQDMAIEYVEACAMWARAFDYAAGAIEEGIWDDGEADKHIKTFTIRFPGSGRRVVALSSRPANLRGKQGVVVIDEAAFHDKLDELIKAALALLIWGGEVHIISTHDGEENPFNELIGEIRAGKRKGEVFRCDFRQAVADGLYERVCLRLSKPWSAAGEAAWIREVYDFYGDDADEELDVNPRSGSGRYLTRALVEGCSNRTSPLVRLARDDAFTYEPEHIRQADVADWCERELRPLLTDLDPDLESFFGSDFARSGDASDIWPAQQQRTLNLRTPFIVELRNIPFDQQFQVLCYIVDRLPRFMAGAMDARGNGQYLAEKAAQKYGANRIAEVMLSAEWYRQHMPRFKAHFEDRTLTLPAHVDVVNDLLMIRQERGIAKVPDNLKRKGSDGRDRHGDTAIAGALLSYAVAVMDAAPIEYTAAPARAARWDNTSDDRCDPLRDINLGGKGAW